MLENGERMFAYGFEGYWKDVGTIDSLWEANMDLLGDKPNFNIHDKQWRIFSRNYAAPPHFIGENAIVSNSIVTEGCDIEGTVQNCVLSNGVIVEKGAVVIDSVIMSGTVIKAGAQVKYSIIDSNSIISENAVVGQDKSEAAGITVIGSELLVKEGAVIPSGAMVNNDSTNGIAVIEA